MKTIEINEKREHLVNMFQEADFDKSYLFFYDETNNLRKFYVKEEDFNSSFSSNFILGGLVFEKSIPDLSELFKGLGLQKSTKDVKLKHIAKGDFINCLKSRKLHFFLKYLLDNNICIHFTWLNILYWSIADIVDSAIANSETAMKVGRIMKDKVRSDFYKFSKIELNAIINLFYKYKYPNLKKEDIVPFIDDLISLFHDYLFDEEFHFGLESLRQVFEEARDNRSMPFLESNDNFILIKDFSDFYLSPLYLFKNSEHYFDNEDSVKEIMDNTSLIDGTRKVSNFYFLDSKDNLAIQASDILVGIIGKLSNFLNTSSYKEVKMKVESLNDIQKESFDIIIDLIDFAYQENPGFLVMFDCKEETDKFHLARQIRNKKSFL